ncbi:prepilin peptidase [Tateyamaria sp. SN3-11]|uniref:prepilin peptidase n=1 Tax=Tateyamaria sp. SN3-11 TaxID=3092147 RepID=UPI0039EA3E22
MEVGCALIPLVAMWRAETYVDLILGTAFLWVLAGLALCDATRYRLPDPLMLVLYATGFAVAATTPGLTAWAAMMDMAVGLGIALIVRWSYWLWRGREGLGFGDVLLFGGLALTMGAAALPMIALVAAIGALAGAAIGSWRKGQSLRSTAATPFGAWLCLAAAGIWVLGI